MWVGVGVAALVGALVVVLVAQPRNACRSFGVPLASTPLSIPPSISQRTSGNISGGTSGSTRRSTLSPYFWLGARGEREG